MRQVVALTVALWFVAASVVTAAACAGWQATPSARKACCAASQHGCDTQMAADACCGQAEQGHQQQLLKAAFGGVALPLAAVLPAVPHHDLEWSQHHAPALAFERSIHRRPHGPPLLLLTSVLLI